MKLIENWGTGLLRVQREVTEFGLRAPEFVVSDSMFRVNIYRMSLFEFGEKLHPTRGDHGSNDDEAVVGVESAMNRRLAAIGGESRAREVLSLLHDSTSIATREVGERLGLKPSRARDVMATLVEVGLLERRGSNRNAHYVLPSEG